MIESILIRNWKGHKTFECKFEKGLNFIIGPNGIGKSSILEAIYFGITGEVKSRTSLRKMKTIDSEGPMRIEINLFNNNNKIKIEHIYRENRTVHTFYNLTENYSITGKGKVEREILNLFDTKKIFLKKMFYYGEGDIFKVISSSKTKFNFREYIEDHLGIEKLKEFGEIIKRLKSTFIKRRKEFEYEVEQMISFTLDKDFSKEKENLNREKENLKERQKKIERELSDLRREKVILKQKINNIDDLKRNTLDLLNIDLFKTNIFDITERLKADIDRENEKIKNFSAQIDQKSNKLERVRKDVTYLTYIVNIVEKLEDDKSISCPVCDRPFDAESYQSALDKMKIFENIQKSSNELESNLEKMRYTYQNAKLIYEKKINLVNEIQRRIFKWDKVPQEYEEMNKRISEVDSQIKSKKLELDELKNKIEQV
ncbi:MAG: AAA family ATPase, partial [Promethearchaeota archaeon]